MTEVGAARHLSLNPTAAFDAALRGQPCKVFGLDGVRGADVETARWRAEADASDHALLARCHGATVDIGCGPGRMTAALLARGVAAMGIDVAPEAVRQTRARGGVALERDVFSTLPGEGRWQTALLADGNIGIAGDPVRLLRRIGELLMHHGRVVLDVADPGGGVQVRRIRLQVDGVLSSPFRWAVVPADQLERLAVEASFELLELVHHDGRWLAELMKAS